MKIIKYINYFDSVINYIIIGLGYKEFCTAQYILLLHNNYNYITFQDSYHGAFAKKH